MVSLYVKLVSAGLRTFDSVPPEFKEAVRKELDAKNIKY